MIGSGLIVVEVDEHEYEKVNQQTHRKQDAIKYVDARPALQINSHNLMSILAWENAYEYLHNRL